MTEFNKKFLRDEIEDAVKTGNNAQEVLSDVLRDIAENIHCPEADGFEGHETYPDCGVCVVCIANIINNKD